MVLWLVLMSSVCFCVVNSFPDQGQWTKSYTKKSIAFFGMHKTLYAGSTISLSVTCDSPSPTNISISWILRQTSCFEEYLGPGVLSEDTLRIYYECPSIQMSYSKIRYMKSETIVQECSSRIHLEYNVTQWLPNPEETAVQSQNSLCDRYVKVEQASEKDISPSTSNAAEQKSNAEEDPTNKAQPVVKQRKRSIEEPPSSGNKVVEKSKPEEKTKSESEPPKSKSPSVAMKAAKLAAPETKDNSDGGAGATTQKENQQPPKSPLGVSIRGSKLAVADMDGVYLFVLNIQSSTKTTSVLFNATVDVSMKGDYGYLSAVDWPLLPFYGFMCGVYVIYAFAWLFVSALQWRDLLRIQFWIGGVILLGLMEKAVFYAEYQSINSTGQSVQGAVLFAEILSCMKRTLARMLVIIVSLGFGIVKPRLGPMLHRVVGVGALYFILGTIEGCLRVLKPKNDPSNQALMAGIPLAVTDSAICWWIFSSLVQTIRTLRLRRNVVKLSLYRHFTNTLIFAVVASVAYMIWSIHSHKLVSCITDWKELWVDEAYWHLLFSVVLLVIMILWRPTNNNQRYAFTPLLDAMDDEDDGDDMDTNPPNDAFAGMKMRTSKNQPNMSPKQNDAKNKQEDDLKWVEENIPSSLTDTALPSLLDSDEEIMTAKFERSKME